VGPAGPGQKRLGVNNLIAEFASPFVRQAEITAEIVYQQATSNNKQNKKMQNEPNF